MATMGKYCKAYSVLRLRSFPKWTENSQNLKKEKQQVDGKEVEVRRELTDDSYLFLQENFTVTDGIFLDENVIFSDVTPEWIDYCRNELHFEPESKTIAAGAAQ